MNDRARLLLVAGVAATAGWFARGALDVDHEPLSHTSDAARAHEDARRASMADHSPPAIARRHISDRPPSERAPRPLPSDTIVPHVNLTLRETLERLPELLIDAAAAADEDRVRALLGVASKSGRDEYEQLVRDALVSDDVAYDLGHRDDTFETLLMHLAGEQTGAAAEARLRLEIERNETSAAFIGGYARILGRSRTASGRAYLEELLRSGNGLVAMTGAVGLLASGDPEIVIPAASSGDLGADNFERFLDAAGDEGLPALRRALLADGVRPRSRSSIAGVLGASGTTEDLGALLEAWDRGYQRAAASAFMSLREAPDDAALVDRARAYVLRAIEDEEFAPDARGSALYVVEYSPVFQTDEAVRVLEPLVTANPTWGQARAALKEAQKNVRKQAAGRDDG